MSQAPQVSGLESALRHALLGSSFGSNQQNTLCCHLDPKCRIGCALIFVLVREQPMLIVKDIEPSWSGPIAKKANFQHE
ncbi:MAG TPA: hypothetical protein DCE20_08010 [Gammaproteobacteria bacterium]|nr:hypothetical protein [Gammaproteobacteria bacterium]